MMNMMRDRLKRPAAREIMCAVSIALTAAFLAGCGHDEPSRSNFAAEAEIPSDYEFPLVHPDEKTSDGRRELRLDSSHGTLEIAYMERSAVTKKSLVKVGMQPVSVRVLSNREAWVVDPIADSISIVDLDTATVITTLQAAPQPTDVHFAGLPSRAYVTVAQGRELLVFDPIAPTEPLTRIALQLTSRYAEGDGY